jgi:hypothetical protein
VLITEVEVELGLVVVREVETEFESWEATEEEIEAIVARNKCSNVGQGEKNIQISIYQGSYRTTKEHTLKTS